MKPVPHGKPYAGNLHVRFDEGADVPDEGRLALLHRPASRGVGAFGLSSIRASIRSDAHKPRCPNASLIDALMVREVLQSVIGSLRLRCGDPVARLTEALDAYALDKTFKIEDFLFPLQKA